MHEFGNPDYGPATWPRRITYGWDNGVVYIIEEIIIGIELVRIGLNFSIYDGLQFQRSCFLPTIGKSPFDHSSYMGEIHFLVSRMGKDLADYGISCAG